VIKNYLDIVDFIGANAVPIFKIQLSLSVSEMFLGDFYPTFISDVNKIKDVGLNK
jgi:hypothetical protein